MKVSGNSVKNFLDTHPPLKDMIMESSTDISMAWQVFLCETFDHFLPFSNHAHLQGEYTSNLRNSTNFINTEKYHNLTKNYYTV